MKRITITRDGNGTVEYETVTVDSTETVFFLNLDPESEDWPTLSATPVGAAPSDPSSQCFPESHYGCQIPGHEDEQGIPDYDKVGAPFNSGGNGFKAGQAPGTHWYHAHKHGSTSLNIRNGLAGVFIIESSREGGYDHFIRKSFGWGDKYGEQRQMPFPLTGRRCHAFCSICSNPDKTMSPTLILR